MKISARDAASIMEKYASETTPLLATIVSDNNFNVRTRGRLRLVTLGGEPWVFIGGEDEDSDFIKFRLVDCEYEYGDLREVNQQSAEKLAHKIEALLCVVSRSSSAQLTLFERKLP